MISVSPTFKAALESAETLCMADLYTITTKHGIVLRQTTADVDLYIEGNYYDSNLIITRDTTRAIAGVEVDTLTVTIFPQPGNVIGALPIAAGIRQGILDGARFVLERAFFAPTFKDYIGKVIRFSGRVADVDSFTRSEIPLTIKSDLEALNTLIPREIYQPGCRRVLYGPGCDLVKASFATNCTVATGSTASTINGTLIGTDRGFTLGTITMTSGANTGESRTVKNYASGVFTLTNPLPTTPAIGDTFMAYAGCDRTLTTCTAIFANSAKFSGEPYIPAAETAY